MNEVVNGLAGRAGAELAVIPRGTGGDFVRTFGIPSKLEEPSRSRCRRQPGRSTSARAVPRLERDGEESCFANIASAGMSGAVAKRTNEARTAPRRKASYLWATLAVFARWRNAEVRVTVDGEARNGPMYDVVVANGRYFGGGMKICPEAEPDDGLFDVAPDRRRDEARPRADDAEDLPRHAPPAPEGRAAARARRRRSTPTSRCPSSSTASSPGRRRRGSTSCRGRCGCACPRLQARSWALAWRPACARASASPRAPRAASRAPPRASRAGRSPRTRRRARRAARGRTARCRAGLYPWKLTKALHASSPAPVSRATRSLSAVFVVCAI